VPLQQYKCNSCGFTTKRMVRQGTSAVLSCARCGDTLVIASNMGSFKFAHQPGMPAPTNSGASSVDHDVDVIIGRDSQLRLQEMEKRQDRKRNIMRQNSLTSGHRLSRMDDGDYFVMSPEEEKAARTARNLNSKAMRLIDNFRNRQKGTKPQAT
jgi:hypothetical protein